MNHWWECCKKLPKGPLILPFCQIVEESIIEVPSGANFRGTNPPETNKLFRERKGVVPFCASWTPVNALWVLYKNKLPQGTWNLTTMECLWLCIYSNKKTLRMSFKIAFCALANKTPHLLGASSVFPSFLCNQLLMFGWSFVHAETAIPPCDTTRQQYPDTTAMRARLSEFWIDIVFTHSSKFRHLFYRAIALSTDHSPPVHRSI